jgi:hypothetical protein
MWDESTHDPVREKCLEIAAALEYRITPREAKLEAAIILRNSVAVQPHCCLCGAGPGQWNVLYQSPIKPNTWVCDNCATYVAIYVTRLNNTSERQQERWLRLKTFAP